MIPRAYITAWRTTAPWPDDAQVEQDLVLSRALVEVFNVPLVRTALAFRGGTALHKLFFEKPGRYSEDIDLVQKKAEPIGPALNAIRAVLDSWLGEPKYKRGHGRATLQYRFDTTMRPVRSMRLKIEINTREHFTDLGFVSRSFGVDSPWFSQESLLSTFELEELLATKLRALYQRKKGRDLYDLWLASRAREHNLSEEKVVDCFRHYMQHDDNSVTRAQFEKNIAEKLADPIFLNDITPLLSSGTSYDTKIAATHVLSKFIALLPGAPWKGTATPPSE